jgi:hypothetical protein
MNAERKSICIEDFCGTNSQGLPVQFWADWDGKEVVYGGDWEEIPPLATAIRPSVEDVHNWAHKHIYVQTVMT